MFQTFRPCAGTVANLNEVKMERAVAMDGGRLLERAPSKREQLLLFALEGDGNAAAADFPGA